MKPILLASFYSFYFLKTCRLRVFRAIMRRLTGILPGIPMEPHRDRKNNSQVDDTGAPGQIILTGSDGTNADLVDLDYTIPAVTGGIWSFNWQYHTNDADAEAQWDRLYVLVNGTAFQLTDDLGDIDQSGTYTSPVAITAGTVVGFRVSSIDNQLGNATMIHNLILQRQPEHFRLFRIFSTLNNPANR